MNNYLFSLLLILSIVGSLGLQACRKKTLYTTTDLEGKWIRYSSNKPMYDSMQVSFSGTTGTVLYTHPNGDFTNGSIKWKEVSPFKDSTFKYKDLGSDNTYYDGTMVLSKNNSSGEPILHLRPSAEGDLNGNSQFWIRY